MDSKEANTNLGYLCVKYRNGFEAKKYFEKALNLDKSMITAEVGLGIAKIQNRELDSAKEMLLEAQKTYKSDPLANLSLTYFLMDSEKETPAAQKIIGEYVQSQGLQNDMTFREAVQETQHGPKQEKGLPEIE